MAVAFHAKYAPCQSETKGLNDAVMTALMQTQPDLDPQEIPVLLLLGPFCFTSPFSLYIIQAQWSWTP